MINTPPTATGYVRPVPLAVSHTQPVPIAVSQTEPVPIATSDQVYVVAPPQHPHSFATGEPLELVEEEFPLGTSTENWVLSPSSDVYNTHVDVGTLRGYPGDSVSGALRGLQQPGLVHESPGSDVVLLYTPPPPPEVPSPTVVLQGPQNIDMAISNFHIKFDKRDSFKPGDEISGKVI